MNNNKKFAAVLIIFLFSFTPAAFCFCNKITGLQPYADTIKKSSSETVTDINGNVYTTVKIGSQVWMTENLKVTRYRNGDVIDSASDNDKWSYFIKGAWCNFRNISHNDSVYGKLYNWYAVNDKRGLCPKGWHVSTNEDWTKLISITGGRNVSAGSLKSLSSLWDTPNGGATNATGFSAIPGGVRNFYGRFYSVGTFAFFWTSTTANKGTAHYYRLSCYEPKIIADDVLFGTGFSCRCVKD